MTELPQDADADTASRPGRATGSWYGLLLLCLLLPLAFGWFVFRNVTPPADAGTLYIQDVRLDGGGGSGRDVQGPAADKAADKAADGATLPYRCPPVRGMEQCRASFRLSLHRQEGNGRLVSLYIPAYQGRVTVFLNGVFLATSDWEQSETDSWSTSPLLVPLPDPLLQPGTNDLRILLTSSGAKFGFLGRVAVGPDVLLRADYDRRTFLFSTLPRLIDGWEIAMGVGMLIMWIARPRERIFLLVGAMLLSQALTSLPAILGDVLGERILLLANHARFVSTSLILPLACLFVGRRPPVPIRVFLLLPAAVAASLTTLPLEIHQWLLFRIFTPIGVLNVLAAALVLSWAAFKDRNGEALPLLGAFLLTLILATHDLMNLLSGVNDVGIPLSRFAAPLLLTAFSAVFMWRFAVTMNMLDRFNSRLKREVAATEEALLRSFERERIPARAATLEAERVRLMSDLHDGIAGQLVSTLALCELREVGQAEVAGTVGAALADLRLIVASLDDYGEDLGVMLALFRERIEQQVAAHGVELVWRTGTLPDLKGLHPGAALAIFRILQEAATNALRHSGSAELRFEAAPSPVAGRGVRLRLGDRGRGGAADRPGSHGMGNMRRRADGLGATLTILSDASGTTVTLDLPARLPPAAPSPTAFLAEVR